METLLHASSSIIITHGNMPTPKMFIAVTPHQNKFERFVMHVSIVLDLTADRHVATWDKSPQTSRLQKNRRRLVSPILWRLVSALTAYSSDLPGSLRHVATLSIFSMTRADFPLLFS